MESQPGNPARFLLVSLCLMALAAVPASAFTADSFTITVDKSGDAIGVFRFTLEGLIENSIPQSMLEQELVKGFATSSEPPELISMDRSSATIRLKKFADVVDVPTGTEYRTASMDFKKAQTAVESSSVSSIVTADFSPATMKVTFPDNYERTFSDSYLLPSMTHIIVDPAKAAAAAAAASADPAVLNPAPATNGAVKIVSSPEGVEVAIDGQPAGTAPYTFTDLPEGSHTFQFARENYQPVTKTINVKAGQTVQVSVFLSYIAPTTAAQSPGFAGIAAGIALIAGCLLALRRS